MKLCMDCNKVIIYSFLALVILASICIGRTIQDVSSQTNDANISTASNLTIGNWTTYTNNLFGISFNYPSDWEVSEKKDRFEVAPDVTVTNGEVSFKFLRFTKVLNDMLHRIGLTETVKQFEKSNGEKEDQRIIENTDMIKYKIDGERTGTFLYTTQNADSSMIAQQAFVVEHTGHGYLIVFEDPTETFDSPETQSIMNKILISFKFIR